ncbi:MAG: adenylate/guanylate cyclase domain-containing protein [Acidiferrobacterales bacterium]
MNNHEKCNGQPADAVPTLPNRGAADLRAQRREVSMLLSSIRGFAALAEATPPARLIQLFDSFLARMSTAVASQDGLLNRFPGDAISVLQGLSRNDHALSACHTALAMVREFRGLQAEWTEPGFPPLRLDIGISTGPMVVAGIGTDITTIGNAVQYGAHIESLNKIYGTNILLSEATYRQAGSGLSGLREIDIVQIRGRLDPARIYELMLPEDYPDMSWLPEFLRAYELFRADLRPQARSVFQRLTEQVNDPVSRHYLKLCLAPRRRRGD